MSLIMQSQYAVCDTAKMEMTWKIDNLKIIILVS